MILTYTDDRSTFIVRSMIKEDIRMMTMPEFICLKDTLIKYPENSTVIFDVNMVSEDIRMVAARIRGILEVEPNTLFIFFAPGYEDDSVAVCEMRNAGIKYIITSSNQTDMKTDLILALDASKGYSPFEIPVKKNAKEEVKEPSVLPVNGRAVSVSVIGTQPRIGTTTQAVQAAKSLIFSGHRACYMEMNRSGMTGYIRDAYSLRDKGGYINADGVDMYFFRENISDLYRKYDYIVFDYGSVESQSSMLSYFDRDYRICVAGTAPGETRYLIKSLRTLKTDTERIHYVFSFVTEDEKRAVNAQIRKNRNLSCHFASYTPDMFSLEAQNQRSYAELFEEGLPKGKKK